MKSQAANVKGDIKRDRALIADTSFHVSRCV
jgi:hypothetical protein